jgi:hypothetical protein
MIQQSSLNIEYFIHYVSTVPVYKNEITAVWVPPH